MACISPIGIKNPKKLKFRPEKGRNYDEKHWTNVPCGTCPACLKKRANDWAFRLNQQSKIAGTGLFVTLTYDNDHVNISKNGFMTLRKKDFQDFAKRLRKAHPEGAQIKYYAVGEYGSKTQRPHFHAIMFGVHATEQNYQIITKAWSKYVGDIHSRTMVHVPIGGVYLGSVEDASINYTTKYICKGKKIPAHPRDDREKESALMSKQLGLNYLTPAMQKWHKEDLSRNYVVHPDGWKSALPRYYRDKIYDGFDRERQRPIMEELLLKQEERKRQEYINRTGSLQGYDLSKVETHKAYIYNFKKQEDAARAKI